MNARETLSYFQARQGAIVDLIRGIVDIESPSHDAAQSRIMADWVEREARATGADIRFERISVADGEHVLIRSFPGEERGTLLLGHTDTVHPIGTNQKNPTRIDGDKFYGCGVFDMKSGVVLMLEALRFFAAHGIRPSHPITVLLSCDEEVGSHSGREFVEREAGKSERCLVMEPSAMGKLKTGRKGTGMFAMRSHGVPAHAGLEPDKGANAVAELARQIDRIHAIEMPELGTTVNVTTFNGGTTTNVIPDLAECAIDVRFSTEVEGRRVLDALAAMNSSDDRVRLEFIGEINRPPMERTDAVAGLFRKARSIAESFNYSLDETQVGGASDGNFVGALGVPLLDGLGITGDGAHRLDEHILVSDIANRATLVTLLLSED